MLNLQTNNATGDNTDVRVDNSTSESSSSGSSVSSSSVSVTLSDNETACNKSNCSKCVSSSSTDSDTEEKSNSQQIESDSDSDEDNKPLSVIKSELEKESIDTNRTPKAYFKTTRYELVKYKRSRVFKCLVCEQTEKTQRLINEHYRENHGKLVCDKCQKICNTVSSLRKHEYSHTDIALKYPCDDCNRAFPFSSQLKSHRKKHLTGLEFHCIKCPKSFKNKGELTKHQSVHSGKTWSCKKCNYTCVDPRNLRAHMHSHGDSNRYKCLKCAKGFKYYEQMKRHRTKDCV